MFKFKKYVSFIIMLLTVTILVGCGKQEAKTEIPKEPIRQTGMLMGTVISVSLYDYNDEASANEILSKAFDKIVQLENILSLNEAGTEVDKINKMAGKEAVKVSDDTFNVIKSGLEYTELSKGKFDITIGPLVKLWSIGLPEAKVPTKEEIDVVLPLINIDNVILDETNKTIFLSEANMMLDLGGIAKGYSADIISSILTSEGINSAIIDLGGNIFAHGIKPSGDKWKIGIQNPFSTRGEIVGAISVENKSIVTSGIYERFIEENGIKYHHILNPQTGYPYENDIAGITIISDSSCAGDALSTAVFALGVEEGINFIENLNNVDAIFVTNDNKIYLTSGIKDNFELKDESFSLVNS